MSGTIKVYWFTQKLTPIMSSEQEIIAEPYELARAAMIGKYAIEDTQKKPAPKRYDSIIKAGGGV